LAELVGAEVDPRATSRVSERAVQITGRGEGLPTNGTPECKRSEDYGEAPRGRHRLLPLRVSAGSAEQPVAAGSAEQPVATRPAEQPVAPGLAEEAIASGAA
jgi:hypothetical protein